MRIYHYLGKGHFWFRRSTELTRVIFGECYYVELSVNVKVLFGMYRKLMSAK